MAGLLFNFCAKNKGTDTINKFKVTWPVHLLIPKKTLHFYGVYIYYCATCNILSFTIEFLIFFLFISKNVQTYKLT